MPLSIKNIVKDFRLNLILRIILICLNMYFFFFLVFNTRLYSTAVIVCLLSISQFYFLYLYVERANRTLIRFLQSIRYSDFSQSYNLGAKSPSFDELGASFNEVTEKFLKTKREKEEHFLYLQTVIQHISVGLIAYKNNGEIELINTAAKRLLKVHVLHNIEQIKEIDEEFAEKLWNLKAGERLQIKLNIDGETKQFAVAAAGFILKQQEYLLVSLQNIQNELEEKEMEAWQTLIRTLTHEIMNSITPISSLASTAKPLLKSIESSAGSDEDKEIIADISKAVTTIEKRSSGLLHFVQNYRKLTRIPKPVFKILFIRDLIDRTVTLMKEQMTQCKIACSVEIDPPNLEITADPDLLEQVMINLCKNAAEAVSETAAPAIKIKAFALEGSACIQIIDNGCGIHSDAFDKIFVPFYTTKKEGSGVGLSLSKQIMRLHKGSITVASIPNQETVFTIKL